MPSNPQATISRLIALGGAGLEVVELPGTPNPIGVGQVTLGVHRQGPLPREGLEGFDILLSSDPAAPRPWVGMAPDRFDAAILDLRTAVAAQPVASAAAAQVLRTTLALDFGQALVLESLTYSMLLASDGFRAWRSATPGRTRTDDDGPRVSIAQDGAALAIRLTRPAARNAVDARMRDELCEALAFALDHPDAPAVILGGEGPAFSAGGDLNEFGSASDPGAAHLIRTLRSPARLVRELGDRMTARLHGACVGAGIEVPAAASRITARPGTVFRLPEVSMGLIPGAGGTATLPRRIGRRRTAWLAICGAELDLETALAWGLVDAVAP